MKPGQTVYTVNAKTNKVDEWTCAGTLRTPLSVLVHLRDGDMFCFLPIKCVYETREKAEEVAALK